MTNQTVKKPNRKPSIKQRRAVDNLVGNGGNVTRAMIDAGYSPATANTPSKLTESEGYKALLEECGLTKELVAKSLVEDINAKPQNRKPELDLAANILGMKKAEPERPTTQNVYNLFYQPQFQQHVKQFEAGIKDLIANENKPETNTFTETS